MEAPPQPWLATARPALFAALTQVCDRLDRDLAAEQERSRQMLEQLRQSASEKEAENGLLRRQLAQLAAQRASAQTAADKPTRAEPSTATAASTPLGSTPPPESNDMSVLKAKCSELHRKFVALDSNFKAAKDAIRKKKDEGDGWFRYATFLEKRIVAAEKKHGISILDRRGQSARAASLTTAVADADAAAELEKNADVVSNGLPDDIGELPAHPAMPTRADQEQPTPNPQSESTQGEADDEPGQQLPQLPTGPPYDSAPIKQEPSSDTPVVVSEREVRKRKRNISDQDAAKPRPKAEPGGDSSPIISGGRGTASTQESLDLGDIEQRMVTPRKPRKWEPEPEAKRPSIERPALEPVTSLATPCAVSATLNQPPSSAPAVRQVSVLTPLSVNVQRNRPGDNFKGRPRQKGIDQAISDLAEDGGFYGTHASAARNRGSTSAALVNNLELLLNSPSPAADTDIPLSASRHRELPVSSESRLPIPQRRDLPFDKSAGQAAKSPQAQGGSTPRLGFSLLKASARGQSPQRKNKGGTPSSSSSTSLRSKPLSELRLDDFKINPSATGGHDFAFSEVVRDKDKRACLPGCTDMHCCGKQFRSLALSQRPNPPLTPAQRLEERRLLEEYLGDAAYRLASMTSEEKAELWVEAKAHELANKYGKHRHRFSRMQSPPGFWNPDFPSTQELQADREEAAKRERQAVAERHREAMRPGGRWVFRDE